MPAAKVLPPKEKTPGSTQLKCGEQCGHSLISSCKTYTRHHWHCHEGSPQSFACGAICSKVHVNHQHASFFLSAVRGSYVPGAALVRTGYIAFSVQPISHKDIKQIFQFAGPMHMQHVALMNKFKTGLQRSWFLSLLVSVLPTDVTP